MPGSTAWVESWSIISIALGTIPAPMIADTVFEASSIVRNAAMRVRLSSGRGVSFTVISVTMPSVPSEPTNVPTRSYPSYSRALPPSRTMVPSERTSSRPVT